MPDPAQLKPLVFQSLIAGLVIGVVLLALQWCGWPLASALASTNFVLFALPHSLAARPRNAIGGHL
ncbi:MAG: HPP family protein [Anaerolineae bacterium]